MIKAQPGRRKRSWRGLERGLQMLLQLSKPHWSGAPRIVSGSSVRENPNETHECIVEAVKQSLSQDLLIGKCEQTRPQCQQMSREVPAVHRRNVERCQRFQRLRVVSVVEVASVPFQGFHRAECIRRALDELSGRDVAEVVRGQIRE